MLSVKYHPMKNTHIKISIFLLLFSSIVFAQTKPDRFESAIVKFEQEDQEKGYHPESVLFTGSSSIRMWKTLAEDMAPIPVINRGFGGSTIPEVLYYADRIILPHQPKYIVLYCGENDLSNDETKAKEALKSFKAFHKYLRENLPDSRLYFIAIKPSISREQYWPKLQKANKLISKFISKQDNYLFVDTASKMLDNNGIVLQDIFIEDNLHMNAKGYDIWTNILKPILEKDYTD
jgi:lysophospholipase L1-like esterase